MKRLAQLITGHWQLIVLTGLIFLFWQSHAIYPLRMLVVFLHELSHALAVIFTGGSVEHLSLSANEGGEVLARGGNRFITLSAGYLGSLLIGALLFVMALRTEWDRLIAGLLGGLTLFITLRYAGELFPILFGCLAGAGLMAMAWFLSRRINDMALRIIGLTSMIYVPYDIFDDTIARSHLRSDARMMAEEFGGPTMVWGGLWLILSLIVIGLSLRHGLGRSSNIRLRLNAR